MTDNQESKELEQGFTNTLNIFGNCKTVGRALTEEEEKIKQSNKIQLQIQHDIHIAENIEDYNCSLCADTDWDYLNLKIELKKAQEQLTTTQQALDSAVEALDYIADAQFVWLNDDVVDEESLRPLRDIAKAALASISTENKSVD